MSSDPRDALMAVADADGDVGEGALWIAAEDLEDVDPVPWLQVLDELADELRTRLGGDGVPAPGAARVLAALLDDRVGLRGADGVDPAHHYLNLVLARGPAIPIACSAVWIAVGRRAGLQVEGVGLPGHFVCRVGSTLVDPHGGGTVLDPADVRRLISKAVGNPVESVDDAWLERTPTREVLARMSRNLRVCHAARGHMVPALRAADRCVALLPDDAVERRERGLLLWRMGIAGAALNDVRAYLDAVPAAPDRAALEKLVAEARARLN